MHVYSFLECALSSLFAISFCCFLLLFPSVISFCYFLLFPVTILLLPTGTPSSQFNLLLDTGSSNFALAAYNDPNVTKYFNYRNSTTYINNNKEIEVKYTQGNWKGVLGRLVVSSSVVQLYTKTLSLRLFEILTTRGV